MERTIKQGVAEDGIDRRGFLKCMAWVGTGLVWTVGAGIPGCNKLEESAAVAADKTGDFSFVFKTSGTYDYFCAVHPHMTGKVIVK